MSAPSYIPTYANSLTGIKLLTPEQANISGEGTSNSTLQTDFAGLASYLCAITGGCQSNSSSVTSNGTYDFGTKYFFNSNNKCSVVGSDNTYCNPTTKEGDSVYEYIYMNTTSNGLLPGVLTNIENMAKIPAQMIDAMSGLEGSSCKCVTLNVTGKDGTEQCAGAFINTSTINDDDVVNNACSSNIITPTYTSSTVTTSPVSSIVSGLSSGLSDLGIGKSGFTTMYLNQSNRIEQLFFVVLGLLALFILYRIII